MIRLAIDISSATVNVEADRFEIVHEKNGRHECLFGYVYYPETSYIDFISFSCSMDFITGIRDFFSGEPYKPSISYL